MSMLPIFADFDGTLTENKKFWYEEAGWPKCLRVMKALSDKDVNLFGFLQPWLTVISNDNKLTPQLLDRYKISFIHVPSGEPKYPILRRSYLGNYIYVGDGLADTECLRESKIGFIPNNASSILKFKMMACPHVSKLETNGGDGVLDEIVYLLWARGIIINLPD